MTTYLHKYKCRCGLHFVVHSWKEDWNDPFCPECGQKMMLLQWREVTDKPIYAFVPGKATMVGLPAYGVNLQERQDVPGDLQRNRGEQHDGDTV